jgi:UDPglucose--hexose-1-phosphate uridylyltransferase
VVETARRVTGHDIPEQMGPRRGGDPAELVADATRVRNDLGWEARVSLEEMVASAWHWHRLNPNGYRVVQEERFNPFWCRWVNIASHRRSRPWRGETQVLPAREGPAYDPDCTLCPGNRRASGETNPEYTGVWAFVNDFPTLAPDSYEIREASGPYAARTSRGVCEVINYSENHSQRLSTLSPDGVAEVVEAWTRIYERLGSQEGIGYVLIFGNRGEIMGNSQLHPHGQVYAYGGVPDLMIEAQVQRFRQSREREEACFVCGANRVETDDGRRLVASNDAFVAYVPFAAQFPYDVMIVPRAHAGSLLELDPPARRDFAEILRRALAGMDRLFDVAYHYSMALIQAPTDGEDCGFHMQIHITSLLRGPGLRKHVVGADIFGRIINPSDPNHSAAEIRRAIGQAEADGRLRSGT